MSELAAAYMDAVSVVRVTTGSLSLYRPARFRAVPSAGGQFLQWKRIRVFSTRKLVFEDATDRAKAAAARLKLPFIAWLTTGSPVREDLGAK